jgi:hypothetical protein
MESLLPLQSTIVKYEVPHHLVCLNYQRLLISIEISHHYVDAK